jgi:two-component system, OmpR family, alkaline phosphatase synthesis response regulator PhoP
MAQNRKKIVVVDDEIHILHVVSLKLRNGGYDVITAQNGLEGLETIQVEQPDVIITDYQMPHLSGLEMCRRLRQNRHTCEIPAILLTARGYTLDEQSMSAAGITHCLHKPFSPREILKLVDSMLMNATVSEVP